MCSLLTLNERLCNDRLKFDIVVYVSITILQSCLLMFREISSCEFQGKTENWASDSTSEHFH